MDSSVKGKFLNAIFILTVAISHRNLEVSWLAEREEQSTKCFLQLYMEVSGVNCFIFASVWDIILETRLL